MRKLLTLAIPLLLGVGLLTAVLYNPEQEQESPRRQAGVAAENALPAVIEEATTTTMAPVAPPTTAAPATTTTTAKATPKPAAAAKPPAAPRPAPTTTTTVAPEPVQAAAPAPTVIDCGTGAANARASLVRSPSGTAYELAVTVVNESTKAIEMDHLVVRAVYANGAKEYTVAVAGKVVQARPNPSEASFSIPESSAEAAPISFEISEFRFHTAGLPECASQ